MQRPLRPKAPEPQAEATAHRTGQDEGLRPLARSRTGDISASKPTISIRPKRRPIASACEDCRRRKMKCDGGRPICGPCSRRGVDCSNAVGRMELMSSRALRNRHTYLNRENEKLWELYGFLYRLAEPEASEVLARLRNSGDPFAVLQSVRDSSLLLSNPDPYNHPTAPDPRLERLELDALQASTFRLTARPWTVVAGDGIVPDLITSFFVWDDAFFYPFIHRRAFLDDMRQNDPRTAKYCSPFLVNAICASRCFTSRRVKVFSSISKRELSSQFLNEAKKHLDLEGGRVSLPTAQGLALLFTVSAYRGTDRAGMMYRFASYDMLRHLNLEEAFQDIEGDETKIFEREIISKAVWGFFCFEWHVVTSIVGYVYLQLSLLPMPRIPRCFERIKDTKMGNRDILGNPYLSRSQSPPFVNGMLDATCELSLMLYKSMSWNSKDRERTSKEQEVGSRVNLVKHVLHWRDRLPDHLKEEMNFTPQTGFLRIYVHEVVLSALRLLKPDTILWDALTAKEFCLRCSGMDQDIMERYFAEYSFREYSCMTLCGIYNTLLTAGLYIQDSRTHSLFARACYLMVQTAGDYPMARFILQGMRALIWSLKVTTPPGAAPYLENLGRAKEELRDVPIAFILPQPDTVRDALEKEDDQELLGIEMGVLLSKWGTLSVD